jgi:hypothetical protein
LLTDVQHEARYQSSGEPVQPEMSPLKQISEARVINTNTFVEVEVEFFSEGCYLAEAKCEMRVQ